MRTSERGFVLWDLSHGYGVQYSRTSILYGNFLKKRVAVERMVVAKFDQHIGIPIKTSLYYSLKFTERDLLFVSL